MKITLEEIQQWLIINLAKRTGFEENTIEINQPFVRYGLDSIESVTLAADLGDWAGYQLSSTILWDYPTIESLSSYLLDEINKINITS